MSLYYIKQDNTVWCCEEDSGPYYEQIEETFVFCESTSEAENIKDRLQNQNGGGAVLKFRKASELEQLAYYAGKDDGFQEGINWLMTGEK